jgi:Ca2+-binding EF-hand superfamily protein
LAIDRTFTKNNPHKLNNVIPKESVHKHVKNSQPFKRHRIVKSNRYKREKTPEKRSIDQSMANILRDQRIKEVEDKFKNLFTMNIPKIQLDCSFTRKEVYMIYTKFKALSKISKVKYPEIVKDVGVEKSIFINCLQEENVNNKEFLEKIFDVIDRKCRSYLNWEEFFQALKLVSSRDLKDKIDLFFYIVDSDGNGLFSYDEIRDIC